MSTITVLLLGDERQSQESPWELMGQLVWHMQQGKTKQDKQACPNKVEGKVEDNPQLSSDLQTHTVCRTHAHIHTHKHPCVHVHTNTRKNTNENQGWD